LAVSGGMIKRLRLEAGLTQKRLAELVGVSQAHVAKIECGRVDPRLSTVNRILLVLSNGSRKKARDVMTKGVLSVKPSDTVLRVSLVMLREAVSQVPVMRLGRVVGTITEETLIRNLGSGLASEKVGKVMDVPMLTLDEDTSLESIRPLLIKHQGVLVSKGKEIVGIITRSNLLKTID
jgi:predicted transcriptional regulator